MIAPSRNWMPAAERSFLSIILLTMLTIAYPYPTALAFKHSHIRTAALTYSLTDNTGASFVGRHYDIAINPSGNSYTIIKNADPQIKCLRYLTISSYRGTDYDLLTSFCSSHGYICDSMSLWATNHLCIDAIAPAGPPCNGNTSCSENGEKLEYCGWNSFRTAPDFRRQEVWQFVIYKYLSSMGNEYDGVMEDEAVFYYHPTWDYYNTMMVYPFSPSKWSAGQASYVNGWNGYSHDAIRDSLMYLKQHRWLPMMMDSLRAHGKLRFANPAAYGVLGSDVIEDVGLTGTGVLMGEGMHLRPLGGTWNSQAWDIMEYIAETNGYAIVWTEIIAADSAALGSWARCQMERLAWYYMVADTSHFYFLITGNELWLRPNDYLAPDSLYKWVPAIEFNIGQPISGKYIAQTGSDPSGQSYSLYARVFADGIVLWRGAQGSNYGNNSAVSCNLGSEYRELYPDGSLGNIVTAAILRNCEGKIYIPESGSLNNPPSAPGIRSPQYGETVGNINPILIVDNATDADGDPLVYFFQLALDNSFNQSIFSAGNIPPGIDTTTCQVTADLIYGTDYYWRCRAFDGTEYGSFTSTGYFHLEQPYIPAEPPDILSPSYGQHIYETQPFLTVTSCNNRIPDPLLYFFELAQGSQIIAHGNNIKGNAGFAQWQVSMELDYGIEYYWRCRVHDGTSFSFYSPIGKFTIDHTNSYSSPKDYSAIVNSVLQISNPYGGRQINSVHPQLEILNLPDVPAYSFEVSKDNSFSNIAAHVDEIAAGDSITTWVVNADLPPGKMYYWKAHANSGYFSAVDSFFVSIGVHIFPNPFRRSEGHRIVTFRNLPNHSHIKIATVSGKTVNEFDELPEGDFSWDLRNREGDQLAPGIYLYMVDFPGGTSDGKLVVIR